MITRYRAPDGNDAHDDGQQLRQWGRTALLALALGVTGCAAGGPKPRPGPVVPKAPDPALVQLAERMDRAIAMAGSTPGREYANSLRGGHHQAWAGYYRGTRARPTWPTLAAMTNEAAAHCALIEAGPAWPLAPTTHVVRAAAPPVIDGVLDEAVWRRATTWSGVYRFNETNRLENPRTTFSMLWDERCLYVAFDCDDTDIVAPDRPRDDHVYNDDCVEMFILPDFQFRTYWEIVIGPNGSIYDSVQCKDLDNWGLTSDKARHVDGMQVGIRVRGTLNQPADTDQGYTVEVAVPFAALPGYTRATPKPGDRLHFMLVRLDRQGREHNFYAFTPLQAWGHNIWNHAVMELAP